MRKSTKDFLGLLLLPFARAYIRHFPLHFGKREILWKFFWRERRCTTKTRNGVKIGVRTNDMVQGYIYYFGTWEPNLTEFIKYRLNGFENRLFVDIGANVGYFSLLAAQMMPKGEVVSIEALPSIYRQLKSNIALNDYENIRTFNVAATDVACQLPIYKADDTNEGATSIWKDNVSIPTDREPTIVKGLPLTDIISSEDVKRIKMIKIDVEGAEYNVFKGSLSIFENLPADAEVVMEVTPLLHSEALLDEIFTFFIQQGFCVYLIDNNYSPEYYFNFKTLEHPRRIHSVPEKTSDLVFSRIEGDYL
ncbi:MAG: FkbM family methyltransferase [Gammaproteobacteria bacterium]|nr:FkbM family methyltransferase [Gammaproteobacteria bacterium]